MMVAVVPPFHPAIVPSSMSKMKRAGLLFVGSRKSVVLPLKTCPVGVETVPVGEPAGGGMVTTIETFCGLAGSEVLYRVALPVPLSDTHQGLVALCDTPHAFCRSGSVTAASPGTSETRLVCW